MKQHIITLFLILGSVNCFSEVSNTAIYENSMRLQNVSNDGFDRNPVVYTVLPLSVPEEVKNQRVKNEYKQDLKKEQIVSSHEREESFIPTLPVVDHHSIKMNLGIDFVRKCIAEESEGTAEDYINEGELRVTSSGSGLFKNIEILRSERMPLYLRACFMSGFSRVIYAQPMDGEDSTIRQKYQIKLTPENPNPANRLKLNLLGKISLELSMKSKLLMNQ